MSKERPKRNIIQKKYVSTIFFFALNLLSNTAWLDSSLPSMGKCINFHHGLWRLPSAELVCVCVCAHLGGQICFFFFLLFFFFSFFFLKGTGVVSYLNVLAITAGSFLFKETAMFIRCLCCSVSSTSDMFEAIWTSGARGGGGGWWWGGDCFARVFFFIAWPVLNAWWWGCTVHPGYVIKL